MGTTITLQVFVNFEVFDDGKILVTLDPRDIDTDFLVETAEDFEFTEDIDTALIDIQRATRAWTGSPVITEMRRPA